MSVIDLSASLSPARGPFGAAIVGIALHHTVTSISAAASEAEERAHLQRIDRDHLDRGWGGFGYQMAVCPSGRIYAADWGKRAHVARRNHELVGIVVVGDLSSRALSGWEVAHVALAVRVAWKRIGGEVPVRGHRDWVLPARPGEPSGATACPGRGTESIAAVLAAAKKDAMTPEEVRRIVDARLAEISREAGLGTASLGEGLGALWSRVQRLGQRLREAGDTTDPSRPWR